MLRACLFGPLALHVDGVALAPPAGATARSVLAWLLAHPGLHMRAHVAARFWPEVVDSAARASLRTALWEMRRAAQPPSRSGWLHASRERIGVPADAPRWIDVEVFEERLATGRTEDLEEAVALAHRPFLTDLVDDWVLERRDAIHDRTAAAALELARRADERGDGVAALDWTRQATRHAPLDEQVHRALMRRLATAGDRAQALVVFERLRAALAAELATEPSPATAGLAERLRRSGTAPEPTRVLEETAECRAPALEVWRLLQDPMRYPDWWEGLDDIRDTPDGLTRWMGALPGVPIPTRVDVRRAAGGVVIRCEITGIVHVWSLEPAGDGCRVRLRAAVPACEAERWLGHQRNGAHVSLRRLVQVAERAAADRAHALDGALTVGP